MKNIHRDGLSVVFLVTSLSFAPAQATRIDRIDVLETGIYTAKITQEIKSKSIFTGERTIARDMQNVEATTQIPAKLGTFFGVSAIVRGAPKGKSVKLKIMWHYPQPGLLNPQTGTAKLSDEYNDTEIIGSDFKLYWQLGEEWTLVPGIWTLEVWSGNRKLVSQNFTLRKL